jgi:osmotically-inducible protein OsmY
MLVIVCGTRFAGRRSPRQECHEGDSLPSVVIDAQRRLQWIGTQSKAKCFLTQKGLNMKINIAAASVLAGALALPVAGYTADYKAERSPSNTPTKTMGQDAAPIAVKVKAELVKENLPGATNIKVDADKDGVVILSGTAKTKAEAEKAVSIARKVEGVAAVRNNIKVASR